MCNFRITVYITRKARNFHGPVANCYFVIKHLWLAMMDLSIVPVIEIIRDKILQRHEKLLNPQKLPATKVSWYAVLLTSYHLLFPSICLLK